MLRAVSGPSRLLRADVVRLVHHHQQRPPPGASLPQPRQHCLRDQRALLLEVDAAQVDHQAAPVLILQLVEQPVHVAAAGPHRPVEHAQVAHPLAQRAQVLGPGDQRLEDPLQVVAAPVLLEQLEQRRVLVAVAQRVEADRRGPPGLVEVGEAQLEAALVGAGPQHAHAGDALRIARGLRGRGAGPRFAQPDEVGVGVEHDDLEPGLQQQPLEDQAERVGLAGAGLPAEEGVAVEAAGVDPGGHAGCEQHLADRQLGAARRGRASHAATSSGEAGPTAASLNGPASPSTTPEPCTAWIRTRVRTRSAPASARSSSGPSISWKTLSTIWPSTGPPATSIRA